MAQVGQVVAWYICTIVACAFLACRLVVRWKKFQTFYVDDYLLTVACACLIGDLGIQHYMFNLGMAHPAASTKADTVNMMKMIIPGSTLYVTSLWLIKAGMVCFYKRLADRTRYQTIYNITLVFLGATWLAIFLDIIFKCFPVDRIWDVDNPQRGCSNTQTRINYWITILFNIFSDVFIICLPISQVMRIRMPLKQKIGVLSIFLLGILVVITSIIRAIYAYKNEQMITCTVSMIETAIAIVASCLPVLRTLFFGSKSRNGTYSNRYELSSASAVRNASKHVATVSANMSAGRNDSEDELVKDVVGMGDEVINVTREYQVQHGSASFR
ncbi:hypothetical protein ASPWEDRAFT_52103 [Aspergillus wentii DTO 134E9]|uniref:Rhodopsin domain-containing protein n=1 Tax=Aspergillus wentii DTO 134E9 TaxID=1073089 RepID=A0A1L9RFG3_ASPWE|nr:uncharacterized protein ASPWEDRAFT_52103 [Aspergillus wentii DTO 134E9]KAI9925433.1 hypothetical protein MW887_005814 [Aspergillus wentii]OJJ33666.1 hypothetical protein ASPWEDRAFT_52103 [Aspergillus wentii DTO 134E9]